MNRILLVEDDENLAVGLSYALRQEHFDVRHAARFSDARHLFAEGVDLILLDVGLPDGDGFAFCREIRKSSDLPVIFLTACDEEVQVVMGLDMGGDDYMTKPFRLRELVSRVRAVLRRREQKNGYTDGEDGLLVSGALSLDMQEAKARMDGADLYLTPVEYRLLMQLMRHPKQALTRNGLLESLWDSAGSFVEDNALSVYIRRLREKISDNGHPPKIATVRGTGYRWDAEVGRRPRG